MHKLALDPATVFGWCLYLDEDELPPRDDESDYPLTELMFYGTWNLAKDDDGNKYNKRGQYAWNLWENINALIRKHGLEGQDIEIILEGESYGSQKSEAGRRMAALWLSVLEMMCVRKHLPDPVVCPIDSWRDAFIQCTKAPKEVGAGMEEDDRVKVRRKWLKDRVLWECKVKRGLNPQSDNEADAIGIMFWSIMNGKDVLDKKRADKKEKALAKKRQAKLPLQVAA